MKKSLKKVLSLVLTLSMVFSLLGVAALAEDKNAADPATVAGDAVSADSINNLSNETVTVSGVSLNESGIALELGKTVQLIATVLPENATDKTVSWSSSAPDSVEVDADGNVTAKGAGANVVITATAGGVSATCTVTVYEQVGTTLQERGQTITLGLGETVQLHGSAKPDGSTLVWTSSDEGIAGVSDSGLVTAVAEGTATITLKRENSDGKGEYAKSCTVQVVDTTAPVLVESVTLSGVTFVGEGSNKTVTMTVGDVLRLGVEIMPANATDRRVTWIKSDFDDCITLGEDGTVTALKPTTDSAKVRVMASAVDENSQSWSKPNDGCVIVILPEAQPVARVTAADGTVTEYMTLPQAVTAAAGDSVITLLQNVALDSYIHLQKEITLDLAGKRITRGQNYVNNNPLFFVNGGILNVRDSGTNGEIYSSNYRDPRKENLQAGMGVTVYNGGTVNLYGGKISGYYGIQTLKDKPGTICIYGGTVSGSSYGINQSAGNVEVHGGLVTGTKYGINMNAGAGKAEISGGTVSGSEFGILARTGAAVVVSGTGRVESANIAIQAQVGADVDVQGGTVTAAGKAIVALTNDKAKMGTVRVSGGLVETTYAGASPEEYGAIVANSYHVEITGGTVKGPYAMQLSNFGGNDGAAQNGSSTLTMSGGAIEATIQAIGLNNMLSAGTTAVISGGTITAPGKTAIYWPAEGTLTITNGTDREGQQTVPAITGGTGIEIKMGSLNITGGSITGNGAYSAEHPMNGGAAPEGSALLVSTQMYGAGSTQYNDDPTLNVNITGGELKSLNGNGITVFNTRMNDIDSRIYVSGRETKINTEAADKQAFLVRSVEEGNESHTVASISGGVFSSEVQGSDCAAGYLPISNGDGTYGVVEGTLSISGAARVNVGGTATLTVSPAGVTGVEWSSSDEGVATVDASGVVHGVANGSAVITVKVGSASATHSVMVGAAVTPPTPVQPTTYYTLTVNYVYADGTTAAASETRRVVAGGSYSVTSPEIADFTADQAVVSGTLNGDLTVTVTYRADEDLEDPDVPRTEEPGKEEPTEPGKEEPTDPVDPGDDVELTDPDVPKAEVPKTGDSTGMWMVAALLSAMGLAALLFTAKRKESEN